MKSLKTYNSEIQLDERGFLRIAFNDTDDEIEFDEIKQQIITNLNNFTNNLK